MIYIHSFILHFMDFYCNQTDNCHTLRCLVQLLPNYVLSWAQWLALQKNKKIILQQMCAVHIRVGQFFRI